jgi:hypothetical protein
MPGYAESVGLASFFQNLGNVLTEHGVSQLAQKKMADDLIAKQKASQIQAGNVSVVEPAQTSERPNMLMARTGGPTMAAAEDLRNPVNLRALVESNGAKAALDRLGNVTDTIPERTVPLTMDDVRTKKILESVYQGKESPIKTVERKPTFPSDLTTVNYGASGEITGGKKDVSATLSRDRLALEREKFAENARRYGVDEVLKATKDATDAFNNSMLSLSATPDEAARIIDADVAKRLGQGKPGVVGKPDPMILKRVGDLRSQGISDDVIKKNMLDKGLDPLIYGLK